MGSSNLALLCSCSFRLPTARPPNVRELFWSEQNVPLQDTSPPKSIHPHCTSNRHRHYCPLDLDSPACSAGRPKRGHKNRLLGRPQADHELQQHVRQRQWGLANYSLVLSERAGSCYGPCLRNKRRNV